MKKVTKFLMMAAIVFGFAACNNEVPNPGNDEGNVWASFTIALPTGGAGTRAETTDVPSANAGDTYIGTAGEQVVNAVRVVLYDGVQVAYAFDFAITADGTNPFTGADVSTNGTAATRSTFVTKAEKVVEKSYKALVLLNPTAASITATQKGNNISQVEQAITATVADLTTPAFLMSNSQGLVDVPTTALKATDVAAEQAPVAVKVDRAVAKVFVGGTPTVEQGATFTGIQWTLDVTNTKTFLMRKLAQKVTALNTFAAETAGDGSSRWDRYAEDPNFTGTAISTDFTYLTGDVTTGLKNAGFADADGIYVLENTMDAASQMNAVTTRVILKGVYTPQGFTEGADWYSYKGFKMKKADFEAFLAQVTDGTGELAGTPVGFKADIWALKQAGQNFTAAAFSKNNLNFYKGGVTYYSNIYIRHFDDTQSSVTMGYGRYGVVRNNLYKLTLGTISQPGEPVVVQPDPTVPDDKKEVWVSFDVEVLPWLVRTQTINV